MSALRLPAGQVMTLEGPNGAGKSSACASSPDLLPQAAGEVRLQMSAGYAVTDADERARLVGWMGHIGWGKSAADRSRRMRQFFADLYGARISVAGVLDHVGLKRLAGNSGAISLRGTAPSSWTGTTDSEQPAALAARRTVVVAGRSRTPARGRTDWRSLRRRRNRDRRHA